MSKNAYGRYLRHFTVLLAGGASLIAAIVLLVDPYNLYGLVDIAHFNAVKPGLTRYQSEIKVAQARRASPQFVIFGNSRVEIGFDPASPAFGDMAGHGYNLGVPGARLDVAVRQFKQLQQGGVSPPLIILGAEFIDSLKPVTALPKDALVVPADAPPSWRLDVLFSLTSMVDVLRTLRAQHHGDASVTTPQGFYVANDYAARARRETYYKMYKLRAKNSATNFQRMSKTGFADGYFPSMRSLLMEMVASGAEVRLVVYPYHAQMLVLFESAGVWPLFEAWKTALVRDIAAVKQRYPTARISLTDFSGFGPYACEQIPVKDERDFVPQWYWEAGHFKRALGDVVVQQLMATADTVPAQTFGMALTEATLAANRARIAAERRACMAAQPAMFEQTAALVRQAAAPGLRR